MIIIFQMLVSCTRASLSAVASATPTHPVNLKPGDDEQSLAFAGRKRTYIVHLPPAINNGATLSLVIVLHGGGGNAESAAKMTGMSAAADVAGFIVVYPDGTGRLDDKILTWNSGNCCGYALDNQIDDVGFIRALIEKLQTTYPIDPKQIYATGISNGGMMAYRLACELSDQLAAIAPVAGALNSECNPAQAVSVIAFHGTADRNVLYAGGTPKQQTDPHSRSDKSVASAIAFWSQRNSCAATPQREERGNIIHEKYTSCANNVGVELYTIKDGGHAWPGGNRLALILDPPTQEISATELMLKFFAGHSK